MKATFFKTPADFRSWFEKNHQSKTELIVGFYKKATKKPSITWPESVDQALCFGWIDGIRRRIDDESYNIRFTPRRSRSHWSAVNLKRIEELKAEGLVTEAGLAAYKKINPNNVKKFAYEQEKALVLSPEFETQIKTHPKAWEFFSNLAPGYKRQTVHWIMSAKRPETRIKRLGILIESSEAGLKIPHLRRQK